MKKSVYFIKEGIIEISVASALKQMISISHNYAALLLAEEVKNSQITKFLKDNGFIHSSLGQPPKTTASDIAFFFEKLYQGEIVDKDSSDKMITLLKEQKLDLGIPKYLEGIEIAHKTGDIGWFKHDGGIVFAENGDYIIVVLSESDFPPGAQERIAMISQSVFEYFQKNKD